MFNSGCCLSRSQIMLIKNIYTLNALRYVYFATLPTFPPALPLCWGIKKPSRKTTLVKCKKNSFNVNKEEINNFRVRLAQLVTKCKMTFNTQGCRWPTGSGSQGSQRGRGEGQALSACGHQLLRSLLLLKTHVGNAILCEGYTYMTGLDLHLA